MKLTTALVVLISTCICGCGGDHSIFVEEHVITKGTFNGLAIGMMRPQVLSIASTLGARYISPTPCQDFRISKSNSDELPSLAGLEGLRVTNEKTGFVDVYFSGGSVSKIVRSPIALFLTEIKVGDDVESVRASLLAILKFRETFTVAPIVNTNNDAGTSPLDRISVKEADIDSHDCWQFEINSVKPAGAVYKVTFATNWLKRIVYRRPRVNVN